MNVYEIEFDGAVLQRGFWLYVWSVSTPVNGTKIYVGRTGDSSSPNAQSPFRRIGQHVDPNSKSKSNALARNLWNLSISPENCRFAFVAIGPVWEECEDMQSHVPIRDRMAAIERRTADWFKEHGYHVLGSHPKKRDVDLDIWAGIEKELIVRFGNRKPAY